MVSLSSSKKVHLNSIQNLKIFLKNNHFYHHLQTNSSTLILISIYDTLFFYVAPYYYLFTVFIQSLIILISYVEL